jgi:hypothetical protein
VFELTTMLRDEATFSADDTAAAAAPEQMPPRPLRMQSNAALARTALPVPGAATTATAWWLLERRAATRTGMA